MSKRAIAILVACFVTTFTTYAIRYGYGVFLPEMLPSLFISKTEAGVIYASYFVAYTIFSPVLGLMGDRYDTRIILTLFSAILGIGTFLMAFSSSATTASLYFAIAGIGASACWAPVMALAQRWVSDRRRGTILALIDVGSSLGIIYTGTAIPLVIMAYSWRTGWMSLGALGFLISLMNYIMVRNRPLVPSGLNRTSPDQQSREPLSKVYARLLHNIRFWLIGLAYLLTGFSILIPFTFLSTYAVHELALPYEVAVRLVMVIGISAMAGKITLGPISDRLGRIRIMMLCAVLIAVGSLGIAYAPGLTLLIPATVVFGLGYGTVWSMYAASASDYFSKSLAGSIVGLWTVFLGVGSILSPIIAGWIADTTGTLTWSFILAMAAAIVSLFLLLPVLSQPMALPPGDFEDL